MIKAIIFDCFGVLCTEGLLPYKRKYLGHDPKLIEQAKALNIELDSGRMSYANFVTELSKLSGMSVEQTSALISDNAADEQLFELIKELKPKYKIGMLSNAGENWLDKIFEADQLAYFDALALSCEIGHLKPQGEAYLHVAQMLAIKPEECVFVDDQERHCVGARTAGMQAILYKEISQFQTDLNNLLADTNN